MPSLTPRRRTASHPELEHSAAAGAANDARRFRRDECRVVEVVQERRLEQLGDGERPGHRHDRLVGVDHPALRDGTDLDVGETIGCGQPPEELALEHPRSGRRRHRSERFDVFLLDRQPVEPAEEWRQPGRDTEAGLVGPVVRGRSEEVVELGAPLGESLADVHLRHRQLVHVGEQRPADRRPPVDDSIAEPGHPATPSFALRFWLLGRPVEQRKRVGGVTLLRRSR